MRKEKKLEPVVHKKKKYICDMKLLSNMKKKTHRKNALFNTKHALNPNLSPLQPRALQCPCEFRADKKKKKNSGM